MEKKKLIIGLLAFVIFIGGASLLYSQLSGSFSPDSIVEDESQGQVSESGDEQEQKLQRVPDFTVYDTDGNPVSLSDYFGKPIVLNFWASWCGPCKAEMPEFQQVYEEMGDEVQFMMINCTGGRETLEKAKEFIDDSGYTFPVYYDTKVYASVIYGASSIPLTFFIDSDGYLAGYVPGRTTADVLYKGIEMISGK